MNKFEEYKKLSVQIDELEEKRKLLKEELAKEIPEEGIKNEFITAVWKSIKKWTYSDTVKVLENKLKEDKTKIEEAKEKEEKEGVATFEETKQLAITPKK